MRTMIPIENFVAPNYDNIGYGEAKCLNAFYSLGVNYSNSFIFYKDDDEWDVYFINTDKIVLFCHTPHLFDACSNIFGAFNDEEANRIFAQSLGRYTDREADLFVRDLSTWFEVQGPTLKMLKIKPEKKDIE